MEIMPNSLPEYAERKKNEIVDRTCVQRLPTQFRNQTDVKTIKLLRTPQDRICKRYPFRDRKVRIMETKDLDYYMNLPYTIHIRPIKDESGEYYHAQVLELDGCQSHGDTLQEASANILEAMEGWFSVKLEHGDPIPELIQNDDYSGKFVVRIPKSLHRRLVYEAEREGVSLNQYALYKLSSPVVIGK
jgi:predicted RNase H-like HicB family nuclease